MSENAKSGGWRENKWLRGAIPALLLHMSIGTVYCWSIFSEEIAKYTGWFDYETNSKGAIEWAFSFAIFFLGMSAAFLGNIVEKDIHKSSLIATICFASGMAGTGFFIWFGGQHQHSVVALVGIYLCYGFIMGVGLGTGYLSPVKTLMLWFQDRKGLATGLAVAGFGAAKAIASPIMQKMVPGLSTEGSQINNVGNGIWKMFLVLAAAYFVLMFMGHLLLKKPAGWHEPTGAEKGPSMFQVIKSKPLGTYIGIWLMFYINITCGLALISQEKMIVKCIGLAAMAGVMSTISAVFNAGGRLGFSAMADGMKDRNTVYKIIFIISIALTGIVILTKGIGNAYVNEVQNIVLVVLVLALLFMVNAGYGGGFSNVPNLLADHYGMSNISAIHGLTLSAWAFAGLSGNQMANAIVKAVANARPETLKTITYIENGVEHTATTNPVGYQTVLYVTGALYVVALLLSLFLVRPSQKALEAKAAKKAAAGK